MSTVLVAAAALVLSLLAFRRDAPRPEPELLLGAERDGIVGVSRPRSWRDWLRLPLREARRRRRAEDEYLADDDALVVVLRVTNGGRPPAEIAGVNLVFDGSVIAMAVRAAGLASTAKPG